MQIKFSDAQLADAEIARAADILRRCVHCGMCQATCPTYVLLGDERDSPRGRIYFIKEMFEGGQKPTAEVVTHIDRCLSCSACVTTCPAGVDYHHLIDQAREYIEANYRRPWGDRMLRWLLAASLPFSGRFRLMLFLAKIVRPFAGFLPKRLASVIEKANVQTFAPPSRHKTQVIPAEATRRLRVALLPGCVQDVLMPRINQAAVRLLTRLGAEVVIPAGIGCCGALTYHLGRQAQARDLMRSVVRALSAEIEDGGLDAVVATASGCGTQLKEYGWIFQDDAEWAAPAARIAKLARDVAEVVGMLGLPDPAAFEKPPIAYHSACSLQHGQKLHALPKELLKLAGYRVFDVPHGHLCCGSAGSYNLLQPEIAGGLRAAKLKAIESLPVAGCAAGNLGCLEQLAPASRLPFAHTVEWLDWATGGPPPGGMKPAAGSRMHGSKTHG